MRLWRSCFLEVSLSSWAQLFVQHHHALRGRCQLLLKLLQLQGPGASFEAFDQQSCKGRKVLELFLDPGVLDFFMEHHQALRGRLSCRCSSSIFSRVLSSSLCK